MTTFIIYKSKKYSSVNELPTELVFHAFKYGDGAFESILVNNGKVELLSYHYERIKNTCRALGFDDLNIIQLKDLIQLIPSQGMYKVRLTYFRTGNAMYYSDQLKTDYIAEVSELNDIKQEVYNIGVYDHPLKSYSFLSSSKLTNCMPYVEATRYAKHYSLDEVIILNNRGEVCESSYCNVFLVKDGIISTPNLESGCVAGTMRAYLLDQEDIVERSVSLDDLLEADEVFLTNAVRGIIPARIRIQQWNEVALKLREKLFSH